MATEDTLDPALQDSTDNPELDQDTDGSDSTEEETQPDEIDYKQRYAELRKDYDRIAQSKGEKQAKKPVDNEEVDWKIEYADRIRAVKDAYTQNLNELGESGAKIDNHLREKALKLAEAEAGISRKSSNAEADRQAAMSSETAVLNRATGDSVELTDTDKKLGVDPETKKKYAHLVQG